MVTVTLTIEGFDIVFDDGKQAHLQWADIKEVFAFKLDLVTYDTIRLGFRVDDSGQHFEVDEDWPGYKDLVTEIERRFDVGDGWWSRVAFPAFATQRTTLWGQSWPDLQPH